jgi:hypothetical protein
LLFKTIAPLHGIERGKEKQKKPVKLKIKLKEN